MTLASDGPEDGKNDWFGRDMMTDFFGIPWRYKSCCEKKKKNTMTLPRKYKVDQTQIAHKCDFP